MAISEHEDSLTGEIDTSQGTDGRLDVNVNQSTYSGTTTTTINVGTSAEVLAVANPNRKFLSVSISCGTGEACMAVRYYPESVDNLHQGVEIIARRTTGNDNLFNPTHTMQQTNIYTGEVSGVSDAGTVEVYVTEGY